jgi:hypothetical protein
VTGFSYEAFNELVSLVTECYPERRRSGRQTMMTIEGETGLYLTYIGSQMKYKELALIFGVVPSVISGTLKRMRPLMINALKQHEDAMIKWPSSEKMEKMVITYMCRFGNHLSGICVLFMPHLPD